LFRKEENRDRKEASKEGRKINWSPENAAL
jgi:hypothetical protein